MCRMRCARCKSIKANDETKKQLTTLYWMMMIVIVDNVFIVALQAIPFLYRDYMPQIKRKYFKERKKAPKLPTNKHTADHSQYHFSLLNFNELPIIIQYSCKIISTLVYRNIKCASLFIPNIIYWCFESRTREKDEINRLCSKKKKAKLPDW